MRNLSLADPAFLSAVTTYAPSDANAAAYIAAVEAVDGNVLEPAIRRAIDEFVIGCKADGIWNAIKASCILAGARTLPGALIPLAGTAPTNVGFSSSDYNRKIGLIGDGTSKYLNSNRNNNADPQNSVHHAVFIATGLSNVATVSGAPIGAGAATDTGATTIIDNPPGSNLVIRNRQSSFVAGTRSAQIISTFGHARQNSATVVYRALGTSYSVAQTSQTPYDGNVFVFARNSSSGAGSYYSGRIAFYSIGEYLDLGVLGPRITTLTNAIAAALP